MMKLLHSADWHLDSPLQGRDDSLKNALARIPGQIVSLAQAEKVDLILLSGDLFDGPCRPETLALVQKTLGSGGVPVCIAPGNHDFISQGGPWEQPGWPENVHIFRGGMESVVFPELDCRVYGAAFRGPESPSLLEGFRADCPERHAVAVLHGDPTQASSPYNLISLTQVQESGLDYLALGHIHKGDQFRAGSTLCAWPGCPMGRGFDETGDKGVLIVTLDGETTARFVPLGLPRFHWHTADDPGTVLPAAGSDDFFRVDITGEREPPDLAALHGEFSRFPNLELRDRTVPPLDLWANAGSDTLEGVYFGLLKEADADPETVRLAASISRRLLLGQEVVL